MKIPIPGNGVQRPNVLSAKNSSATKKNSEVTSMVKSWKISVPVKAMRALANAFKSISQSMTQAKPKSSNPINTEISNFLKVENSNISPPQKWVEVENLQVQITRDFPLSFDNEKLLQESVKSLFPGKALGLVKALEKNPALFGTLKDPMSKPVEACIREFVLNPKNEILPERALSIFKALNEGNVLNGKPPTLSEMPIENLKQPVGKDKLAFKESQKTLMGTSLNDKMTKLGLDLSNAIAKKTGNTVKYEKNIETKMNNSLNKLKEKADQVASSEALTAELKAKTLSDLHKAAVTVVEDYQSRLTPECFRENLGKWTERLNKIIPPSLAGDAPTSPRFKATTLLGEGASGKVYLSMDMETMQPVAMKTLRYDHNEINIGDEIQFGKKNSIVLEHLEILHTEFANESSIPAHPNLNTATLLVDKGGRNMGKLSWVEALRHLELMETCEMYVVKPLGINGGADTFMANAAAPDNAKKLVDFLEESAKSGKTPDLFSGVDNMAQKRVIAHNLLTTFMIQDGLKGLDHAHKNGIIHCDIKPENFLVGESDFCVADFGAAVKTEKATGHEGGSLPYMSEESKTKNHCPASDLFSLGISAMELLKLPSAIESQVAKKESNLTYAFTQASIHENMSVYRAEYLAAPPNPNSLDSLAIQLSEPDVGKRGTAELALQHPVFEQLKSFQVIKSELIKVLCPPPNDPILGES